MILLDTHSLLWLLADDVRLGVVARETLAAANGVYSSSVSVVEVRIKAMLGKLEVPDGFVDSIRESGIRELPLSDEHADALLTFPELARHDPFDRMLLAQASVSKLTLLTCDQVLLTVAPQLTQDARV